MNTLQSNQVVDGLLAVLSTPETTAQFCEQIQGHQQVLLVLVRIVNDIKSECVHSHSFHTFFAY